MIGDYLTYILRNFSRRKIRSWLTIIGILIGIGAVVALISISQGMQDSINQEFEKMGKNKLLIMAGSGQAGFGFMESAYASKKITKEDLEVIQKVRGVDTAAGIIITTAKVKFGSETKYTFIMGFPTDETKKVISDMEGFEPMTGRDLKDSDKEKAMVGYLIGSDEANFFDKPVRVGSKIEIEDKEFSVVGVIKKIGNQQDDSQIYIPIDTAREILDIPEEFTIIFVQIKEGFNLDEVAESIKDELRDFRDEEEDEETFQVQTFQQLTSQINSILSIIGIVFITISAISLVVGGIGIMNSMYTSVLERTHEIGIMKAIGARNSHIMTIFLIESGIYGLVGGILGVSFGLAIAKTAEIIASNSGIDFFKAAISPTLIIGALIFSFLVGCISGLAPARTAAKMKPVDALRYE